MSPTAPSSAELMRRLDELVNEFRQLRADLKAEYLLTAVYNADARAASIEHGEIRSDIKDVKADVLDLRTTATMNRRLAFTAIIAPIIVGIVVGLVFYVLQGAS